MAASTVSRVINNKPGIKAETRKKVQDLLDKYNYTPDVAARGLVMQSTKMVGILIVDIRVTHHINSAFVIEQELTKRGYCSIIMSTGPEGENKSEYIRILEQRRVEGVILMGSMFATEQIKEAIQRHLSKVPVVIVNGYLDLPNVSGVLIDEDAGVGKCADLLISNWKGSGISILLDLISTVLTNANSVQKIGTFGDEIGLSQIMIAIDPGKFNDTETTDRIVDELVADIKSSIPIKEGGTVFYPGEIEINTRKDNQENGIPVIEEKWDLITSL